VTLGRGSRDHKLSRQCCQWALGLIKLTIRSNYLLSYNELELIPTKVCAEVLRSGHPLRYLVTIPDAVTSIEALPEKVLLPVTTVTYQDRESIRV
jgi:hypothetical protein